MSIPFADRVVDCTVGGEDFPGLGVKVCKKSATIVVGIIRTQHAQTQLPTP